MATKAYDIYDLQSPFVAATAPAPQATTTTAATRRAPDRLLRGSAYLLLLAGALLLAAFLLAASPLAGWNADITVPFLAVFLGGLGTIAWAVTR